ncbi:MAG: PAS domain S-box protein [Candidatus Rokubacteria bacterium]|nr:PAS domain S-box protein [Candidatus Rokubacteria bacterium]
MPLLSEQSRRKRNIVIITAFLLLLGIASAFDLGVRAPDIPVASNVAIIALLNLNLIVFLLLLVLLFRNLVKLSFERRHGVLGSKFKAKLVVSFLILAVAPAVLIFVIASNFIGRSIEGWFKPQVERPLDQALAVAQDYYRSLEKSALRHATQVAAGIERDGLLDPQRRARLTAYLSEHQDLVGLSTSTVIARDGRELAHVHDPVLGDLPLREVSEAARTQGLAGRDLTAVRELTSGDLIEAATPIWGVENGQRRVQAVIVVGTHISERLEARVRAISQAFKDYKQLRLMKNPIKGSYILLFLLLTLIVVFSFTWFGLYLARGITGPIAELAEGTREVAAGNLRYKVQARADDELGVLVDSFNRMTDDLSESKRRLEAAYLDLQDKHTELEERRHYIETVLEAITTGVVSFDPEGRVTTINRAAARMFGLDAALSVGRPVDAVFPAGPLAEVAELVHRTRRLKGGVAERELRVTRDGASIALLAMATALRGPDGEYGGAVAVFDDLTELLKAQRLAAWREVAQRIAHEIKNPLTPIQLSAQRLRRRLTRVPEERALVDECTETIIQEVDALKRLVDEFSRFARMPAPAPRPTDVRPLVDGVIALYRDAHPALTLGSRHADDIPVLEVDPDHVKRAVLNLVDNAVAAVNGVGEVEVETALVDRGARVQIIVSDAGPGIPPAEREKLFQPYYSTKVSGMGLGLAIVQEIVAEHRGTLRIEDNVPRGSRFVMELPVTPSATPAPVSA